MPASVIQLATEIKYDFGAKVYPVCGPQEPGIVTDIELHPGHIVYCVCWSPGKQERHYDFELSPEKQTEGVPA